MSELTSSESKATTRSAAPMAPLSRDNRPMIVGPETPEMPYPMQLEGVVTKGFGRGARFLGIPTANLPDSSLGPLDDLALTGIFYGFARIHPSLSTPLPSALPSPSISGYTTPSRPSSAAASSSALHLPTHAHGSHHLHPISQPHPNPTARTHPLAPPDVALSPEEISALPPSTAPYPPESIPGETNAPKRLSEEDGRVWPMVMSVGWNPYFKNEKITAEVHIMHPFEHDFYGHDMSVLVLGYIRPELDYVSKDALIDDINTDVKVALNSLARPGYAAFAADPFLTGPPGGHQPPGGHPL